MNRSQRKAVWRLAERLLTPDEIEKARAMPFQDTGYGYDPFGLERETAMLAYLVARLVHRYWFRVESRGLENVPQQGAALLVPNHSGVIPIDAAMLAVDVLTKLPQPRVLRTVVDYFASSLPYVNVFFARAGQIIGHPKNFEDLLRHGNLVGVFPEGTRGVGKPFRERYRLRRFNVGFIELSLKHRVPIIPVAIVGAEEQAPMLGNLAPLGRLFGFPYFPITPQFPLLGPLGFVPLPVKYHITYDEPLRFYEEYPPEAANDAQILRMLADKVQVRIQETLDLMLEQRSSIFGLGLSRYLVRKEDRDVA